MNNPWYDRINGLGAPMQTPYPQQPAQGPLQVAGELAYAMRNPMAYAMNAFKDVPREMWSDPSKALAYIQQTRGLSQADIQNLINANLPMGRF